MSKRTPLLPSARRPEIVERGSLIPTPTSTASAAFPESSAPEHGTMPAEARDPERMFAAGAPALSGLAGAVPSVRAVARPTCAFTIDVEDWFQSSMDFDAPISERVVRNVERVCEMLDDVGVKGTFFVQGKVAEAFPRMLQDLVRQGHEIQSHGYSHRPLYGMDRKALRTELELAVKTVEDACGVRVTAFRAPDFSILPSNL